MSELDTAMARLEAALGTLEGALDGMTAGDGLAGTNGAVDPVHSEIVAERDRLMTEIADLQRAAVEDRRLRAEAADAVKAALADLREIVPMREAQDG
ncbi:MAG: hypothetical protein AAF713_04330 [Pseudomonadota bacterium]